MARQQNHLTCRNINVLAGVVDSIQIRKDMTRDKYLEALEFTVLRFENRFVFQEPEINHPGRESTVVNISKSVIPATPSRLRREETYLFINQVIIVVFVFLIFFKLTAMPCTLHQNYLTTISF